eukprot:4986214-Prymnesium_polylepis.1
MARFSRFRQNGQLRQKPSRRGFGARSAEPAGLARSWRCSWPRVTSTVLLVTPRTRNGVLVARYAGGMLGH